MSKTETFVQLTWTEIADYLHKEHFRLSVYLKAISKLESDKQHLAAVDIKAKLSEYKPKFAILREMLQVDIRIWPEDLNSDHWLERRFDAVLIKRLFEKAQSVFDLCVAGDVRTFVPLLVVIDLVERIIVDYDNVDEDPTDVLRVRKSLEDCDCTFKLLRHDYERNMQEALVYEFSPEGRDSDFQCAMAEFDTVRDIIIHITELHKILNLDTSTPARVHADAYQLGGLIHLDWMSFYANSCTPYRDVTSAATEHLARMLALADKLTESLEQRLADRTFALPHRKQTH